MLKIREESGVQRAKPEYFRTFRLVVQTLASVHVASDQRAYFHFLDVRLPEAQYALAFRFARSPIHCDRAHVDGTPFEDSEVLVTSSKALEPAR